MTSGSSTTEAPSEQMSVWPLAGSSVTYDDPVDAATGFATDLVGFTDPVVGEFQQGDSRSGEVEVRPSADGPVTTVMVRQLTDDDSWVVLAAATANIVPSQPEAGDTITSPVQLEGESTAFEGTVQVTVVGADAGRAARPDLLHRWWRHGRAGAVRQQHRVRHAGRLHGCGADVDHIGRGRPCAGGGRTSGALRLRPASGPTRVPEDRRPFTPTA